jgi:hypothetical protein
MRSHSFSLAPELRGLGTLEALDQSLQVELSIGLGVVVEGTPCLWPLICRYPSKGEILYAHESDENWK